MNAKVTLPSSTSLTLLGPRSLRSPRPLGPDSSRERGPASPGCPCAPPSFPPGPARLRSGEQWEPGSQTEASHGRGSMHALTKEKGHRRARLHCLEQRPRAFPSPSNFTQKQKTFPESPLISNIIKQCAFKSTRSVFSISLKAEGKKDGLYCCEYQEGLLQF